MLDPAYEKHEAAVSSFSVEAAVVSADAATGVLGVSFFLPAQAVAVDKAAIARIDTIINLLFFMIISSSFCIQRLDGERRKKVSTSFNYFLTADPASRKATESGTQIPLHTISHFQRRQWLRCRPQRNQPRGRGHSQGLIPSSGRPEQLMSINLPCRDNSADSAG